jgi:hypothetical protein
MKYPIDMRYLTIPTTSNTRPTSVALTSNTLVIVLLASRAHAHDLLLVSVLEVELKLSNDRGRWLPCEVRWVVISLISKYGCFPGVKKAKNIKNTCKKAWKIVSHNKL